MPLCLCPFVPGQNEGEGAPLSGGACHRDAPLVGAGKGSCQAQAEACPGLGPAVITAVESLEDMGEIACRNADPSVLDSHDHLIDPEQLLHIAMTLQ